MTDDVAEYETLDLTPWCNAGDEVIDGNAIAHGDRTYHGLPFRIGDADPPSGPAFVLLEPGKDVTVAVGRPAARVIVAHRRLFASDGEVEPVPGEVVVEYHFELQGGTLIAVPIRERLQIGVAPGNWDWAAPFLATTAGTSELFDRRRGDWEEAGVRQTEQPWRSGSGELFLWVWENPEPGRALESIRLESKGPRIVVAAVTISNADEEPFVRDAATPIRITMTGDNRPSLASELSVAVDRGTAGYAFPLPVVDLDAFLSDPFKGWGEPADPETPYAYARVSAVPSATLTVSGAEEDLARLRWRDATATGSTERDGVRIEVLESGRSWVHVRVLDDDTGKPVPCRVHFRSPEGVPYQPHGHHDHVNSDLGTWHVDVGGDLRLGRLTYAYIDGTCQGWLPTGDVLVDVARGFEYKPIRESVRIERGQRELELRLKRWSSLNERGWYSGDSHVHFLSTQGALTEQQGEDLNVVNLLQSQWGSLFTNTEDFTGKPLSTEDGRYVTFASQENRQHVLGHLVLWGLKRPVMPWCTDGMIEAELGGALEATESDWADQCHAQGGTIVIPHFPQPNGEPATLIATGRADAVEMIFQNPRFHEEYYRYLNCGYRLPLVGGTDKMSSDVPVGLYRTFANLGDEEFSFDAWRAAVTAGRTFLSAGPILSLDVDGHGIGETVMIGGPGTVTVSANAESIFPLSSLEIVQDGEIVASASDEGGRRLELTAELRLDGDSWIAARCGGEGYFEGTPHRDVWGRGMFAHSSPVYVTTGDEWKMFDPAHARYMLTLIEGSLGYMRHRAVRYPPSYATHHHGEDDHLSYLERPFLQARELLERRLEDERG